MILAIETSTPEGSVAILNEGKLVFSEVFHAGRSHSSELFAVLERALAAHPLAGVRQIVVGLGPGSYAGVRIAISAAVGLSVAGGAELLGVPSIVALEEGDYLALGDARRESFYYAKVRGGVCEEGPRLLEREALDAALAAWGTGALYASEELPQVPGVGFRIPSAERLVRLAAAGKSITARGVLEPIYLREPYITLPKPRI